MTGTADLVPLLLAAGGSGDIGYRQGTVKSWDPLTGSNTIVVAGSELTDLPTLAASTIQLAAGDPVGLFRVRSQYFILGRIGAAGAGALSIRAASVNASESTTSSSYTNLTTPGPAVNAYIGAARQALVIVQASMQANTPCVAAASAYVTGASPNVGGTPAFIGSNASIQQLTASAASMTLLTAADGLVAGLNTFTMKYARTLTGSGGGPALFSARTIIVIPF